MDFGDRGVYEPEAGRVDVPPKEAERHNRVLDEGLVKGLDGNCEVGMSGSFYLTGDPPVVTTWTGLLVSGDVRVQGRAVTFKRRGMTFQGRKDAMDDEFFEFTRVA